MGKVVMRKCGSSSHKFGRRVAVAGATGLALTLVIGSGDLQGQAGSAHSASPKSETTRVGMRFDVVSIKPTPSSDDKTRLELFPDRTSFHGAPVRMVLRTAFGVDDNHVVGAPAWVNSTRFDIEAKVAPEDAAKLDRLKGGERNAMLIPLLADRFKLKFHHEKRELSTYALVVAKGGPKLARGETEPPGGYQRPDPDHPVDPAKEHYKMLSMLGHIEADSVPVYALADPLTVYLGRTVVDKTDLKGNYNFTLKWVPENGGMPMMREPDGLGAATAGDSDAPLSLFTAIQEQLGLKLVPEKNSVDVIVIDHIDPPSAN